MTRKAHPKRERSVATDRGEYRPIYEVMLDGPDFQKLDPPARLVLLVAKIGLGPLGMNVLYPGTVAARTGLDDGTVAGALADLSASGWLRIDGPIMWVVRGLQFEPTLTAANDLHRKFVWRRLAMLPKFPIVAAFRAAYPEWFADETPEKPSGMGPEGVSDGPTHTPSIGSPVGVPIPPTYPMVITSPSPSPSPEQQTAAANGVGTSGFDETEMPWPLKGIAEAEWPPLYRDGIRAAFAGMTAIQRTTWGAELSAIQTGMHGPAVAVQTIAAAFNDFAGKGLLARPSLNQFRAYVRDYRADGSKGDAIPPHSARGAEDALATLDRIMRHRGGIPGNITKADIDKLNSPARKALAECGWISAYRDLTVYTKPAFVRRFTALYAAALRGEPLAPAVPSAPAEDDA